MGQSETFTEVATILFGDGASELIAKMNPDGADLSVKGQKKDRRKRRATAGLSAVGAAAGAYGLGVGANEVRHRSKAAGSLRAGIKATPKSLKALVPLEIAGLTGEVAATHILHGDSKKKIKKNQMKYIKSTAEATAQGSDLFADPSKRKLMVAAGHKTEPKVRAAGRGTYKKLEEKVKEKVKKGFPEIEISKVDEDKRQVFGWASVVEKDGVPVVDLQGDFIPVEEMEKSAYSYVRKSRKAGDMHQRVGDDPRVVGEMIESFVVTNDKKAALGLPEETPTGWWVGLQIEDENLWADIKSGKRTGFSVHGTGRRTPFDG